MHPPDRIIRLKTVLFRTGLSRSTIYRKIAEGTFPVQLKISTNGTGWRILLKNSTLVVSFPAQTPDDLGL